MRTTQNACRSIVILCLAGAIPVIGFGQGREPAEGIGGPLTGAPVLNAPFSADAITTVRLTLPDGTRLDQTTAARYYRNRAGRARVELRTDGLDVAKTLAERHLRTIVAPTDKDAVTLDPVTRTARYVPRSWVAYAAGGESPAAAALDVIGDRSRKGGMTFAVPIRGIGGDHPGGFLLLRRAQDLLNVNPAIPINVRDESLGNRRIADVETMGRRLTMTIPPVELGNERPFVMADERWESPELTLLVAAHLSDSRMGEVEYRLTNIRRLEPPAGLFVVPSDYAIDTAPTPHDQYISLFYYDRYPRVGVSYVRTMPPR